MNRAICLDASVLVKLYLPEPESESAEKLVSLALAQDVDLIGPTLLLTEVLSVLRQNIQRSRITPEQSDAAASSLLALPIELVDGVDVHKLAWKIASDLNLPVVYDAVYLAVSELRQAPFWTADRILFQKATDKQDIHMLGDSDF